MTIEQAKQRLAKLQLEMSALGQAQSCIYLDGATVAPRGAAQARGQMLGILSEKSYQLFINDENKALLEYLIEHRDELDEAQARQAILLKRDYDETMLIPMEEYAEFSRLSNDSANAWLEAKERNDYELFRPYLEKVLAFSRKFAGYRDSTRPAYDVMLDSYEKGLTTQTLDAFFAALRKELVPLVLKVKDMPLDDSFLFGRFDIAKQEALADRVMALMGLDKDFCVLSTTEHPFTLAFNRYDVRITTHYHEDAVASSLYSVIHEGGHGLYERGVKDEYQFTCLADGASMSLHESQSRFYENIIGRSQSFCHVLLPMLKELFPEPFAGVDEGMLFRAVNKAQPSLIRTEADELTYCLHIMVRYELEKRLVDGTLSTKELPSAWNEMYRDYLGVTVPNDAMGVLQDMHWSEGMFAYFPSYALGSAYGAQFQSVMRKSLDVDALVRKGDLAPITGWLAQNIHQYGKMYDPKELIEKVCGEPFDAKYYVDYLKGKMKAVYGI